MNYFLILVVCTVIVSALGVRVITPRLISYFERTGSLDIPNHRSAHKVPTPSMGGIAFFAGLICTTIFTWDVEIMLICSCIACASLLGLWDDLNGVEPKVKFLFQGIIATGLFLCGISIAPFLNLIVDTEIPIFVDWSLTILFVLGVKNAFNLIDGIDGLLISTTLISSIVLSAVFYIQHQWTFLFLTMSMVGVASSFLVYNFQPAKIFMGDTGSLFIGTYISACILKIGEFGNSDLSLVSLSIVLFACVDMLRLFLGRYLILKKPFRADSNHFHHILMRLGWSHKKIVFLASAMQLMIMIMAAILPRSSSFYGNLLVLIFVSVSFYGVLQFLIYRKHRSSLKESRVDQDKIIGDNQLFKSYLK